MKVLIALLVGVLAGLHTATWGMYKDAVHEGFTWPKYLRSVLAGAVLGVALGPRLGLDLTDPGHLLVLFGVVYVLERVTTELYKTFVRDEDQSKYFIPMQFAVRGRLVRSRLARLAIASVAVFLGACLLGLVVRLQASSAAVPTPPAVALIGSLGGWVSAFGGAWKDAPFEGFEIRKFFRSPVIAGAWALLLFSFVPSLALVGLAALGFTIATLETYKTFYHADKPRGKFAGKPVHYPAMLLTRRRFVPLYTAIWVAIVGMVMAAMVPG